ncbi:MAG: hypothetical protein VX768_14955 [Planctomycetota bacterium]|nr:hypothetical protein [Planctomycetota bacterium]
MATPSKRKYSFGLISRLGLIGAFVGLGSWAVFNSKFKAPPEQEVAENHATDDEKTVPEAGNEGTPPTSGGDAGKASNPSMNPPATTEATRDTNTLPASFVDRKKPKKIRIKDSKSKKKKSPPPSSFPANPSGGFSPPASKSFESDSRPKDPPNPVLAAGDSGFKPQSKRKKQKKTEDSPGSGFSPSFAKKSSTTASPVVEKPQAGGLDGFPKSQTDSGSSSPPPSTFSGSSGFQPTPIGNDRPSGSSPKASSGFNPSGSFNPSGGFQSTPVPPAGNPSPAASKFLSKSSSGNEKPLRGKTKNVAGPTKSQPPGNQFSLSGNGGIPSQSPAASEKSSSGKVQSQPNRPKAAPSASFGGGPAFLDRGSKPLPAKPQPSPSGLVESSGKNQAGSSSTRFGNVGSGSSTPNPSAGSLSQPPKQPNGGFSLDDRSSQPGLTGQGSAGLAGSNRPHSPSSVPPAKIPGSVQPSTSPGIRSLAGDPKAGPGPQTGELDNKPGPALLEGVQASVVTLQKFAPPEIQVDVVAETRLVVRNTGRTTATNITIVDPVPDGTEFVQSDPPPTKRTAEGHLSWQIGSLKPNEQQVIAISLLPKKKGEIGSIARMSYQAAATSRSNCTQPEITLTHQGPQKVLQGQNANFMVTVTNKGDGVARDVKIEDEVPHGFAFGRGTGERIAYEVGNLGPGDSRDVVLTLKAVAQGRYTNEVRARVGKTIVSTHRLAVEVTAPVLKMEIVGPTRKYINRMATYKVEVQNLGTAVATNVNMKTKLPRGMKFVGTNNQGQYYPREHAVYWSLVELAPQNRGTVELKLVPTGVGTQEIEFEAGSRLTRTKLNKFPVVVDQLAELFFEVDDAADPIEVNGETEYRIRVVNQGSKAANNVMVRVEMPEGIRSTNTNGPTRGTATGQVISFAPVTQLPPRRELIYKIRAQGVRDGDHLIKVLLSSDEQKESVAKQESTKVYSEFR